MNGIKTYGKQGLTTVGTWPHEVYPRIDKCTECKERTSVELYMDSRQGRHYVKLCRVCVTAWRAYRKGYSCIPQNVTVD